MVLIEMPHGRDWFKADWVFGNLYTTLRGMPPIIERCRSASTKRRLSVGSILDRFRSCFVEESLKR